MRRLLKSGWELLGCHKKALIFLYLGNLSVASLLLFPFMKIFEGSLGSGLYREKMLGFDYDWFTLFQDRVTGFAATFSPTLMGFGPFARNLEAMLEGRLTEFPWAILSVAGVYAVLNSYLLAAAVGSFALDPRGTTIREFFRNGGEFFGRFIRLMILAFLTFWVVNSWVVEPLEWLLNYIQGRALHEATVFYCNLARFLLLLLLFLFLNMLFDYARIKTAIEDRTSVMLASLSALTFCITYSAPAFGFYLIIAGIGVLWALIYTLVEHFLPQQTAFLILLGFLWQQFYLIGRLGVRLLFYSAQLQFLLDRERPYRPSETATDQPGPAPHPSLPGVT